MQRGLMNYLESALAAAGRRAVGGARRPAALRPLEGARLGRRRPGGAHAGDLARPRRAGRALPRAARRDPRRRLREGLRRRAAARSPSTTGHERWTPPCCSSRRSASCRPRTSGCAAPCGPCSASSPSTGSSGATTPTTTSTASAATRAPSSPAASGWPTRSCSTARSTQGRELFERLLDLRNDVGLLAEEYDVAAGRQLGNYPAGLQPPRAGQLRRSTWPTPQGSRPNPEPPPS